MQEHIATGCLLLHSEFDLFIIFVGLCFFCWYLLWTGLFPHHGDRDATSKVCLWDPSSALLELYVLLGMECKGGIPSGWS